MRVFEAVYVSRSFTRAADALGISQPAISQNISELEKTLGCRLFSRAGGKVSITPQVLGKLEVLFPDCGFSLADTPEDADACIVSVPARQDECLVFRFQVLPVDRPLSEVIRILLEDMLG